jgi:hypothetical protein
MDPKCPYCGEQNSPATMPFHMAACSENPMNKKVKKAEIEEEPKEVKTNKKK